MNAAEVLRVELDALREAGETFDVAWRRALPVAVAHAQTHDHDHAQDDDDDGELLGGHGSEEWAHILDGMRSTWRAAYECDPPVVEPALTTVEEAGPERLCEWCESSIEHLRPLSRFCGSACYNAMLRAKRRERLGTPNRCENCGRVIEGRRADSRACSTACAHKLMYLARRERARKAPPLENCVVCGATLEHLNADAEVCSRKCVRVRANERRRVKRAALRVAA